MRCQVHTKHPPFFIVNGQTIISKEKTIETNPWLVALNDMAFLPRMVFVKSDDIVQKWYADDRNAVRTSDALVSWHRKLEKHGFVSQ